MFEGISFDAEGTLILYKDGMSDSELYVDALIQFNAMESQAGRSTIRVPTWVDRQTQKAAYSQAWELGMHQVALELKLSQEKQRQWDAGVYGPLMHLHTAVRLYRLVTFYYFCSGGVICTGTSLAGVPPVPSHMQTQSETPAPTPITSEGNFEAFTYHLIFQYYLDLANLRMPRSFLSQPEEGNTTSSDPTGADYCNTPLWRVLKEEFPQLHLCVVSNTDSRIRDALYQFPLYKKLFSGRIFTACDVPETKPSGAGILMARKQLLASPNDDHEKQRSQGVPDEVSAVVPAQGRQARKLWLHVGDELHADGQAALSSGSLFLCCGKKVGVDLEALKAVLRSREPESLLKQLNEPFVVK